MIRIFAPLGLLFLIAGGNDTQPARAEGDLLRVDPSVVKVEQVGERRLRFSAAKKGCKEPTGHIEAECTCVTGGDGCSVRYDPAIPGYRCEGEACCEWVLLPVADTRPDAGGP